jgi:hypothetical protein
MMRPIKAAAFVFLYALGASAVSAHDEADDRPHGSTRDKIRIIALQPSGPVKPGVETTFNIQIEADLGSAKEGLARVAFNLDSPTSYRIVSRRDLHEGKQKVSFAVKVVPVDWAAKRGQFEVMVNMGPKPTENIWAPTAFVRKAIPVKR